MMQAKFSFHAGERAVQVRAGEVGMADRNAVVIANTLHGGAKPFLEKQFMVVLSSIDTHGAVWSSILYGAPGFVHAADDTSVHIHAPVLARDQADPFWANIQQQPAVGMLFIELGSRRRYRVNGQVQTNHDEGLVITVNEAYPNCPKYIQKRHLRQMVLGENVDKHQDAVSAGSAINAEIAPLIRRADTLFVASANDQAGADASHRGGAAGFVQILDDHTLRIPDFSGNGLFNTLGNIETNAHAGICIPDFNGQRLLQLIGRATTLWNQDDPENLTGGTHRFWEFKIEHWLLRPVAQHLAWEFLDASPFNPPASGG